MNARSQNIIVVATALAIILLSIMVTLYVSGRLFDTGPMAGEKQGYQNITFTDAVLTCQKSTRNTFGKRIRTLVVDDHSSRYDPKEFLYKIFIKVETPKPKEEGLMLHYVNCFVKSSNGRINKYETWEDKEEEVSPVTENDTNMFGWPK
ncbi:hypothetical protein SAMN02745866_01402 [Alteromonadaceae bacterium Bs31]|nr:hypothetical protein SAMN02745866_01402 [Alteromonadaceae bacterium Bs31]